MPTIFQWKRLYWPDYDSNSQQDVKNHECKITDPGRLSSEKATQASSRGFADS